MHESELKESILKTTTKLGNYYLQLRVDENNSFTELKYQQLIIPLNEISKYTKSDQIKKAKKGLNRNQRYFLNNEIIKQEKLNKEYYLIENNLNILKKQNYLLSIHHV